MNKELLTGKNKEQFESYFKTTDCYYHSVYNIGDDGNSCSASISIEEFYDLPLEMKIGVLLAYYDSFGFSIHHVRNFRGDWDYCIGDTQGETWCLSRNAAYKEAFIEANKIANKQLDK